MRDYGRVFSSIWESSDFRALSEDGRALVLYLLTCQHGTLAGAFRLPDGYVMEDLQWSSERVSEGFSNLAEAGFALRCGVSKWVWVCKYLQWNPLENPNQRKAAAKIAEKVPKECQWHQRFMRDCAELMGLEKPAEVKPLPKGSATVPESVSGEGTGTGEGTGAVVGAAKAAPPAADAPATRGHRLPLPWALPKAWGDWALAEFPAWSPEAVRNEANKFRDFWVGKTGKDATKLDWEATWRNWCRNAKSPGPLRQHSVQSVAAEAARQMGFTADQPDVIDA